MENVNSKSIDYLYLKMDDIHFNDNTSAYGSFYYKVKSKKFFSKWSRRIFICSNKEIHFFKFKKHKRVKKKIIYFTQLCKLSGLEYAVDTNNRSYFKFSLSYNFGNRIKIYKFKSYNIYKAPKLYGLLNNHISNNVWGKYLDL